MKCKAGGKRSLRLSALHERRARDLCLALAGLAVWLIHAQAEVNDVCETFCCLVVFRVTLHLVNLTPLTSYSVALGNLAVVYPSVLQLLVSRGNVEAAGPQQDVSENWSQLETRAFRRNM